MNSLSIAQLASSIQRPFDDGLSSNQSAILTTNALGRFDFSLLLKPFDYHLDDENCHQRHAMLFAILQAHLCFHHGSQCNPRF